MNVDKKMAQDLLKAIEILDERRVAQLSGQLLDDGMEPPQLLDLLNRGMYRVGELYESKDYYIADLIMAGLIFKQVLELEKMSLWLHTRRPDKSSSGRILSGTVKEAIHDIGKNIFRGMLDVEGFEVVDLGVDVPTDQFVKKDHEHKPRIIGLSGVLSYSIDTMKHVVDALVREGVRKNVKIIVGGNHLTQDSCRMIGADDFARDASLGVKICNAWISESVGKQATYDE